MHTFSTKLFIFLSILGTKEKKIGPLLYGTFFILTWKRQVHLLYVSVLYIKTINTIGGGELFINILTF